MGIDTIRQQVSPASLLNTKGILYKNDTELFEAFNYAHNPEQDGINQRNSTEAPFYGHYSMSFSL